MTDYERGVEQASVVYKEVIREYVAENNRLREERHEYQATIDSLVDECTDHKAENAKLRAARDTWQENDAKLRESVKRLMTQRDERLAKAEAENANLRTLACRMFRDLHPLDRARYLAEATELGVSE